MIGKQISASNSVHRCMGTGLIALDVLITGSDDGKASLWAGGSCGNILTILAYLGWLSYPVANHKNDDAAEIIRRDMDQWGVQSQFLYTSDTGITPIVVERLFCNGNSAKHVFQFKCPVCGSRLPRNRPISSKLAAAINAEMPDVNVFYFDRVSKGALALAREQRSRGALVVFEPVILSKEQLFLESLSIAHIVKYSGDQIDFSYMKPNIPLEIQTLGSKGLKYRTNKSEWKIVPPFNIPDLVDSAGAGDWCTAGIIHSLGCNGSSGFSKTTEQEIERALVFGQALSALKCRYKGARGIMYNISKSDFESSVSSIISGKKVDIKTSSSSIKEQSLKNICSACK